MDSFCVSHENPTKYYCINCERYICDKCFEEEHKYHNIKFYNKVNNMKSYYDFETMTEEAKNQVKYMNNLLKQNRFIKRPPSLNYIDIDL